MATELVFDFSAKAPDALSMSGGVTKVGPGSPVPPGKYEAIGSSFSPQDLLPRY